MHTQTKNHHGTVIVAALSVAVLLVAMAINFSQKQQKRTIANPKTVASTQNLSPRQKFQEKDSDGDGFADWQEYLFGSDVKNADSVPNISKNTLVKHAQTKISNTELNKKYTSTAEEVGETLISEYILLKKTGAYNPERGLKIGSKLSENIHTDKDFIPINKNDITTTHDNSYKSVLKYRDALKKATAPLLDLSEAEFVTYAKFVENGDVSALEQLQKVADVYDSVANNVLLIQAPEEMEQKHLDILNSLSFYAYTIRNLVNYAHDPVVSFTLLKTFNDAETYMLTAFNGLASYYVSKSRENINI